MKRGTIRDNRSERRVKPRVMDYIRDDNGQEILEVKDGNVKKTILLSDLQKQIDELRQNV